MRNSTAIALALLLAVPSLARAQSGSASAQAQLLFQQAKAEMKAGKYAQACDDFEASEKAEAAVTTEMNLADCREKNSQIASSYGWFIQVQRKTRDDPKQAALSKVAKQRADALEPRLSYLIINVPDDSKVEGLEITLNGTAVDPADWNRKLPEDGAHYKIAGKAPAHEPWSTEVDLKNEGDQKSVDVPKFKPVVVTTTPPPPDKTGDHTTDKPEPLTDTPHGMSGKRKAAIGLGAVGVIAGVGATFLELSAESKYDDAKKATSSADARTLTDDANGKRHLAIGAAGVGVVALGVGAFLWFTGGNHESREATSMFVPTLGSDSVGFAWSGGF